MSPVALRTPIADDGLRSVNFFNGRLLAAEDLGREQETAREARRRLGLALGDGIAFGLEVAEAPGSTPAAPVVRIEPGLAMSRLGQTLRLAARTEVALVRDTTAAPGAAPGFGECEPPQPEVYVTGEGVYLLVLRPATRGEGRAPVSGLGNVEARCNTRYTVESVQVHLIALPVSAELQDLARLRNRVAYRCFGADALAPFLTDPFAPPAAGYGLLDSLRPNVLTDCDVPLAVLYWTVRGLQFVDLWSVRRRIAHPSPAGRWSPLAGDRRLAEGEAMALQFQEHVDALRATEPSPALVSATQYFERLPPIGVLPLAGKGVPRGFDAQKFFAGVTTRGPAFIEGAKLPALWRGAVAFPPIDLGRGELIWLYSVRESQEAIDYDPAPARQPYLVFTSGHVPYQADARFDVAKWDYSNYALDR